MIHYLKGDATEPVGEGIKLLIHVCNNKHVWGAGFVMALSKRWLIPELYYKRTVFLNLGDVQFIRVASDVVVGNMIAQTLGGKLPLSYEALRICLKQVAEAALTIDATVHAPRFGAGLAGGDWAVIEQIINEELSDVDVFIYDLK